MYDSLSQKELQGASLHIGLDGTFSDIQSTTEIKSSIFWDMIPHTAVKVNRRFRGTF
jgi:hypothetical protein